LLINVGGASYSDPVTATTPDYFLIREWRFSAGGSFTADDVRTEARVAVIGTTVANKIFEGQDAFGRTMNIKGMPFQIVGVLKAKGKSIDGRDQDDVVIVPITTAAARLWDRQAYSMSITQILYVKADNKDFLAQATENVRAYLRKRFGLSEAAPDCFEIQDLSSITKLTQDTADAFSTLLGAIASISLLVGGIGIMNIMLVNVTERTREIGIRKAVGATETHILVQFLMEAVLTTGVGSALGLMLGIGGGLAARQWLEIAVEFDLSLGVLTVCVATGVGIGSGFYPAYRAAKLQPIEALRALGA
jgi:putative ABC transport system permease protein